MFYATSDGRLFEARIVYDLGGCYPYPHRGYYGSLSKVSSVRDLGGYISTKTSGGVRGIFRPVSRKSAKAERHAIELNADFARRYFDKIGVAFVELRDASAVLDYYGGDYER